MRRRVEKVDWYNNHPGDCRPDECDHRGDAFRYVVLSGDCAYELMVSEFGGRMALHSTFRYSLHDPAVFTPCDLLRAGRCVCIEEISSLPPIISLPGGRPLGTTRDAAFYFWEEHAEQNQLSQPESFWKALEVRAKAAFRDARNRRMVPCDKCGGAGFVRKTGD
jgi:hypothetical protein